MPGNVKDGFPNRSFYTLMEKDSLMGILVINKANGCRIGGCDGVDELDEFAIVFFQMIDEPVDGDRIVILHAAPDGVGE